MRAEQLTRTGPPTPYVVYDLETVSTVIGHLEGLAHTARLAPVWLYAIKANRSPGVLQHLAGQGWGADVATGDELEVALRSGFAPGDCSCTGPDWSGEDLMTAARMGARIDLDSQQQIDDLSACAYDGEVGARLRVAAYGDAPNRASRFGLTMEQALQIASTPMTVSRLHVHLGEMSSPERVTRVLKQLAEVARQVPSVRELNLGGGFDELARAGRLGDLWPALREGMDAAESRAGRPLALLLEPGSIVTAASGWLVVSVRTAQEHPDLGRLVTVDASAWNLLGWDLPEIHHGSGPGKVRHTIAGNTCYEMDLFSSDVTWTAPAQVGDRIAMRGMGSYVTSMARSMHGLPLPSEWTVSGNTWAGSDTQTESEANHVVR